MILEFRDFQMLRMTMILAGMTDKLWETANLMKS